MAKRLDRAIALRHLRRRDDDADRASSPDPSRPLGEDTLPQIQHIVILMMENHSYDNYLGLLGRGEGLSVDADGKPTAVCPNQKGDSIPMHNFSDTTQLKGTPTQSWYASQLQYADGANDGWVKSVELTQPGLDATVPMGYWTPEQLPFYAGLARTFPLADRWFCSCLGPTFPNRRFLIAGTANGLIDDVPLSMFDYPKTGTIFDLLDRNGIDWVNYHHEWGAGIKAKRILGNPVLRLARWAGFMLSRLFPFLLKQGQLNLQFTANLYPMGLIRCFGHLRDVDQFATDAAEGRLAPVSIVDPNFQECSEENAQDIAHGEAFAATVINAVMHGKDWSSTLLVWLYDEHGGYYDHVLPPPAVEPDDVAGHGLLDSTGPMKWLLMRIGLWQRLQSIDSGTRKYDRYGYRVPAVVVSPYARRDYVSHRIFDHTAVLRLIERKWNLPALTSRDAAAADLLEMLDFEHDPAFLVPPKLPKPALTQK